MEKHTNEDFKYNEANQIYDSEDVKHIKDEYDEKKLMEMDQTKLMATEIKQESGNDAQFLERNEMLSVIKEEITMIEDFKEEIDEHIITPEILDHADDECENSTDSIYIKSENECVSPECDDKSQTSSNDRRLKCTQCNYTTNNKYNLKEHLKTKHDSENAHKFHCHLCSFNTFYKRCLIKHQLTHNSIKPFQCKVCQKYFPKHISIKLHMNRCHPDECQEKMRMFNCNICEYKTVSRSNLASHKLKHGDVENLTKYKCSICDFSTFYKSYLKQHALIHGGEKSIACEYCDYSTTTKGNLRKHVKNCHQDRENRPHKCNQCNLAFFRKPLLDRHLKTHLKPPKTKLFSCPHCSYSTTHKRIMDNHVLTHSTIKPYPCKLCTKSFTQKGSLRIHMNMHHPDDCEERMNSFQCDKCSYNTIRKTCFAAHKITHGDTENKTQYTCPSCEYVTYYKKSIQSHILKHAGDKPWVCEYCDYKCREKSSLTIHVRRRHNNVPNSCS